MPMGLISSNSHIQLVHCHYSITSKFQSLWKLIPTLLGSAVYNKKKHTIHMISNKSSPTEKWGWKKYCDTFAVGYLLEQCPPCWPDNNSLLRFEQHLSSTLHESSLNFKGERINNWWLKISTRKKKANWLIVQDRNFC